MRTLSLVIVMSCALAVPSLAAPAMTTVAKIDFTGTNTASRLKLPGGARSVYIGVASGRLFCDYVRLEYPEGRTSTAFLNSELSLGRGMTQGAAAGQNYVAVQYSCHGVPAGQLVLGVRGQ
jgi:hypothetical protein